MATSQPAGPAVNPPDPIQTVLDRYNHCIAYYWKASSYNKRSYKWSRYLTIVLGALVTLVASLSSANFIKSSAAITVVFEVLTPVLAAVMAIIAGFSQSFQWGAAWSDMVITATQMEKERDRVAVTPRPQIDPVKEMALLDGLIIDETQGFFQRLFGSGGPGKPAQQSPH